MILKQWSIKTVRILSFVMPALVATVDLPIESIAMTRDPLRIGDIAPRVSVNDLGGRSLRIPDEVRGKVVIIHFWANGCSSCRKEMPAMETLFVKYGKRGLVIFAVNVGQSKEMVRTFVESLKITYPIILDPYKQMAGEYDVISVPRTFIIGRDGLIRYKIIGEVGSVETLNKLVSSLL